MNRIGIDTLDVRPNPATAETRPMADTDLDAVNGGSLVLLGGAAAAGVIGGALFCAGYGAVALGRGQGWW